MSWDREVAGVEVVLVGDFNPALFHPDWLAQNDLITDGLAAALKEAPDFVVSHEVTQFSADWLVCQVTVSRCMFSTRQLPLADAVRDLAIGVFSLLSHTPVDAIGINANSHFRIANEAQWHAFGDYYAPKDRWHEVLSPGDEWIARQDDTSVAAGMRQIVMEVHRKDKSGYLRVEIAPSLRMPSGTFGAFVGMNEHFQLSSSPDNRGDGLKVAQVVRAQWAACRERAHNLGPELLQQALG
jgi:hypothetical protein